MKLANSLFERIADFLAEYPPFNYIEARDLESIARTVRIKFHEKDEIIFEEGTPRKKHFFVLNKGSVKVTSSRRGKRELIDIRKEGDLLGTGHLLEPNGNYVSTAVTIEDTILYAVPWVEFANFLPLYPDVIRYLKANISLRSDYRIPSMAHHVEMFSPEDEVDSLILRIEQTTKLSEYAKARFVYCAPTESMQEVAFKMIHNKTEAIVVVNRDGHPLGMVTKTDMAKAVQSGRSPKKVTAQDFMSSPVITIESDPRLGRCLRIMMKTGFQHLCLTKDGTPESPACGVISERDLMLYYGNNPMVIIRQIGEINSFEELSHMRHRADMLTLHDLRSAESIGWFAEVVHDLNRNFVKKVIRLALDTLRAEGNYMPPSSFCLFFAGLGGRKELFTRNAMDRGLIWVSDRPNDEEVCRNYYQKLAIRINEGLLKCGWTDNKKGFTESNPQWCQPLRVWKEYFNDWIATDDLEQLYSNLHWFDMLPADGLDYLLDDLYISRKIRIDNNDLFLRKLARATLNHSANPSDYESFNRLDENGKPERFDLDAYVYSPLVDMGRVMAYAQGIQHVTSTYERFLTLAEIDPANKSAYEEAAEGFRISLLIIARTGLKEQSNGKKIDPGTLNSLEIQLVKSTFRTVLNLQDMIEEKFLSPENRQ